MAVYSTSPLDRDNTVFATFPLTRLLPKEVEFSIVDLSSEEEPSNLHS